MGKTALRVDLGWDDSGIVPEIICPDTEFVFSRMTEATLDAVEIDTGLVVDIGCGLALDAQAVADKGNNVIGLEPSRVMIGRARTSVSPDHAGKVALVQGIGEFLPFKSNSVDRIVCKGALDHFFDPFMTAKEIARVLKPGGNAVISIANFGSLSCKLGRLYDGIMGVFCGRRGGRRMWEIPPDHIYKFNYVFLKAVVRDHLRIEQSRGISLLWGMPFWGMLLSWLPGHVSRKILAVLDKIASRLPVVSDVIVLKCVPRT